LLQSYDTTPKLPAKDPFVMPEKLAIMQRVERRMS
jgi:hypothetical protein